MKHWVYILSNKKRLTYVGVTDNVSVRLRAHRWGGTPFTSRYRIHQLVLIEEHPDRESAERREKQIKGWSRSKKHGLILSVNPDWIDLSP